MTLDGFDDPMFAGLPQAADLRVYLEQGQHRNHFLTALLENDLFEAVGRADAANLAALAEYCSWLNTYAPRMAYGSRERVAAWIAHRGLSGLDQPGRD
ncbi:MAG: hypothetical protein KDJ36_13300 [Hyphomicrobiaceae bacterium]|nr:hypothetical protein [Hyphomicrobiaceae bacterium]